MFSFFRRKRARALMDSNGHVFIRYEDPKQWRLEMFKRRGYIVNRYDLKEGK